MTQKLLDPIPPGEILLEEFMKPLDVSINALFRAVSVKAITTSAWHSVLSGLRSSRLFAHMPHKNLQVDP